VSYVCVPSQVFGAALFAAFGNVGHWPPDFLDIVHRVITADQNKKIDLIVFGSKQLVTKRQYAEALAATRRDLVRLGLAATQSDLPSRRRRLPFNCLTPEYASTDELNALVTWAKGRSQLALPSDRCTAPRITSGDSKGSAMNAKLLSHLLWESAKEAYGDSDDLGPQNHVIRFVHHLLGKEKAEALRKHQMATSASKEKRVVPRSCAAVLHRVLGHVDGWSLRDLGSKIAPALSFPNQMALAYQVYVENMTETKGVRQQTLLQASRSLLDLERKRFRSPPNYLVMAKDGENWIRHHFKKVWFCKIVKPQPVVQARKSAPTTAVVTEHFDNLASALRRLDHLPAAERPKRVLNLDETHGELFKLLDPSYQFPTIGHRAATGGTKHQHMTLIGVCAASGRKYPVYTTLFGGSSLARLSQQWLKTIPLELQHWVHISRNDSGWTTGAIIDSVMRLVADHFREVEKLELSEDKPILMIMDNCRTHKVAAVTKVMKELHIIPVFLPPYTTHVLQPLDVGVFSPLKNCFMIRAMNSVEHAKLFNALDDMDKDETEGGAILRGVRERRVHEMLGVYAIAWYMLPESDVKSAFAKAGVYPLNRDIVLKTHWVHRADIVEFQGGREIPYQDIVAMRGALIQADLLDADGGDESRGDIREIDPSERNLAMVDRLVVARLALLDRALTDSSAQFMKKAVTEHSEEFLKEDPNVKFLRELEQAQILGEEAKEHPESAGPDMSDSGTDAEDPGTSPASSSASIPSQIAREEWSGDENPVSAARARTGSSSGSRDTSPPSGSKRLFVPASFLRQSNNPEDNVFARQLAICDDLEGNSTVFNTVEGASRAIDLAARKDNAQTWAQVQNRLYEFTRERIGAADPVARSKYVREAIEMASDGSGFAALIDLDPRAFRRLQVMVNGVAGHQEKLRKEDPWRNKSSSSRRQSSQPRRSGKRSRDDDEEDTNPDGGKRTKPAEAPRPEVPTLTSRTRGQLKRPVRFTSQSEPD
jgi:hypothetical protein